MGTNHQSVIMIRPPLRDRALLHFEAPNGSQTFTDEYRNTFSASGVAPTISTVAAKFGSASLLFAQESNINIACAEMTPNSAAWTMESFIRWITLPEANRGLFALENAAFYGFDFGCFTVGGSLSFVQYGSANGTSWAFGENASVGAVVTGTQYHIAVTYDPSNGTFYSYFDGTMKWSKVAAAIATTTRLRTGDSREFINSNSAYIDEFRLSNFCRYPGGTTFTPASAPFTS